MPKKTAPPTTSLVGPARASLGRRALRGSARVGAGLVATRVAAATGKKGVFGILAGMGAKRLIMRYPAGALFVTGAYLAGKVYEAKREVDRKRKQKLLTDQTSEPIRLADARKARKG